MNEGLDIRLNAMFWDLPEERKRVIIKEIKNNPLDFFRHNEQTFIRALNSLKWYELVKLLGADNIVELLKDSTLQKLYPVQRRKYYINARRLLSKYSVSVSGSDS